MMTFTQPKLEIVQCDNGFVIEWADETKRDWNAERNGLPTSPTRGVKIAKTRKEVADFLNSFFA